MTIIDNFVFKHLVKATRRDAAADIGNGCDHVTVWSCDNARHNASHTLIDSSSAALFSKCQFTRESVRANKFLFDLGLGHSSVFQWRRNNWYMFTLNACYHSGLATIDDYWGNSITAFNKCFAFASFCAILCNSVYQAGAPVTDDGRGCPCTFVTTKPSWTVAYLRLAIFSPSVFVLPFFPSSCVLELLPYVSFVSVSGGIG